MSDPNELHQSKSVNSFLTFKRKSETKQQEIVPDRTCSGQRLPLHPADKRWLINEWLMRHTLLSDQVCQTQYLEGERVGVFSQFLNQPLLETGQALLLLGQRRKRLDVRHEQVFTKRQPEDVQILSTISERTGQSHEHWGDRTHILRKHLQEIFEWLNGG